MRLFFICLFAASVMMFSGCSVNEDTTPKNLPTRQTKGDLPWGKPASWEGGLPGMGGIGNPTRY